MGDHSGFTLVSGETIDASPGKVTEGKDHCEMYMATPAVSGAISAGTPVKIGGTTAQGTKTTNFTVETATGGRITYTASTTITVKIVATVSFTSSQSNQEAYLYIAKDGTKIDKSKCSRKLGTGTDVGACALRCTTTLAQNERIEIYCDLAVSASDTITVQDLNLFVEEV